MKNRYLLLIPALVLGLVIYARPATAAAPDAGQMLNQQRQPGSQLPDRLPREEPEKVERPALEDTGVRVVVKGFRFSGYQGLATEPELQALLAESIGQELGFAQLQDLAGRVTAFLRNQKGYLLARAYLPRQEITDGIVEIAVIAGRIDGRVRVNVKSPRRISQRLLEKMAARAIPAGKAIRMEDMERAVLLMNDLPGIDSQASLGPGAAAGTTRVTIDVAEGALLDGLVSGDNYGDRYTGTWRGTGQVAVNDPFGRGDRLSLAVTGAEHMVQGTVGYALPLGATGLSGTLDYTGLYYEVGADMAHLNAKGRADTFAVGLRYPLLRSRRATVRAGIGVQYLMLRDKANGIDTSDRKLPVKNATLQGNFFDAFGGGGLTIASLAVYNGRLDLTGLASGETADAAGPRRAGDFHRGTYSLARLQRITRQISLFGAVRGQVADGNLDSSQKFILGGPTGVRAYPVGEASGDEGHALTVETRFDLPYAPAQTDIQLIGFLDTGIVRLNKNPWPTAMTNATGSNAYSLSGAGAGISAGKPGRYSIRASYAHKIGDNPGRTTAGNDVDNLSNDGRFWLQAVAWF